MWSTQWNISIELTSIFSCCPSYDTSCLMSALWDLSIGLKRHSRNHNKNKVHPWHNRRENNLQHIPYSYYLTPNPPLPFLPFFSLMTSAALSPLGDSFCRRSLPRWYSSSLISSTRCTEPNRIILSTEKQNHTLLYRIGIIYRQERES